MFLVLVLVSLVQSELLMFIEIARHGARAPFNYMLWDDYVSWPNGPGELTPVGMRQHYVIGQYLNQKYVEELSFLSPEYNSQELVVYSTNIKRTKQSAQSQLFGLYSKVAEPKHIKQVSMPVTLNNTDYERVQISKQDIVPIITDSSVIGPMLSSHAYCNEFSEHIHRRKSSKLIQEVYKKYYDVIKVIVEYFNITATEAEKISIDVMDSVACNKFAKHKLPLVFTDSWLNRAQSLFADIENFKRYQPDYVSRFSGALLLKYILGQFDEKINGKSNIKGIIMLAHDISVMDFFAAMNSHLEEQPNFAAMLLIELHKESEEYFVRIYYNEEQALIPGFFNDRWNYEDFKNFTLMRTFENMDRACRDIENIDKMKSPDEANDDLVLLLVFDVVFMFVSVTGIYFLIKRIHK